MHHDARIHGGEVEFGDVFVQPRYGRVDQSPFVGCQQVKAAFERLGLPLLPRHEYAAPQRGGDLHGADAGAGGDAGDSLWWQAREASNLENPVDSVVVGPESVLAVEVPAAEEQVLLVAENYPAVRCVR